MKLDGKAIQMAMMQLVEDYKFDPYQILEISKLGIKTGFKKDYPDFKKSDIEVDIADNGSVSIYKVMTVVEEVEDPDTQLDLTNAKKVRKDVEIWEKLLEDVTPKSMELSRIAAQSAAQTIKQSLKSIEREKFYEKFQDKEGELLKAKVLKVQADTVLLDIDQTTVVLPAEGQIPNVNYESWQDIFVFLKKMTKDSGGVTLDISQTNSEYVAAILEKLIPELAQWIVHIEKIARIAGIKTKVVVSSSDEKKVDAVGVMVGHWGDRIQTVLSLLDWEKIDFVEMNNNTIELIKKLFMPARVIDVNVSDDQKDATVKVMKEDMPRAFWPKMSNLRLAGQIVGMKINLVEWE